MLAIAAGFFGSNNFGDGLANAAKSIYNQNDMIRQEGRPTLGGPDDAFEIYTDPQTGEHVFKPIQAAIDYQTQKRFDPADQADLLGRAMYSILQLPEADRPGAYSRWLSGPDTFGVDTRNLPHTWDPQFAAITSNMGMTVSQARTRDQAASNADQAEAARQAALGLRREMVGIAQRRADASISQGQQRIGIAQAALAKRGSGSGGKGSHKPISEQSDAELLSIIFGD
ncbi:hypothetical protein EGM87_16000 [Sphingobium sp. RSMS]|uniref:hypothetical protein n=1 Tax=Sphingobium sp. RSMS TaxID=520734 RepID=UPI0010F4F394|nr:hypothetical protein [Sphingobium sp. RSMS]UXC90515.1 hypothetical protein EGM87_16000 [Sphingobium sp. RSMS]